MDWRTELWCMFPTVCRRFWSNKNPMPGCCLFRSNPTKRYKPGWWLVVWNISLPAKMIQFDKYFCQQIFFQMGWNHQLETSSHPATPPKPTQSWKLWRFLPKAVFVWWFQSCVFVFNPYLGKWSKLTKQKPMGWNHQPGMISDGSLCLIQLLNWAASFF